MRVERIVYDRNGMSESVDQARKIKAKRMIPLPVPIYRAFNCSADITAPPGLLMITFYKEEEVSK